MSASALSAVDVHLLYTKACVSSLTRGMQLSDRHWAYLEIAQGANSPIMPDQDFQIAYHNRLRPPGG